MSKKKIEIQTVEGITKESTRAMIDKSLEIYSEKARKKRVAHLAPNDQASGKSCVASNKKTIPGVMSARGCAYAGAKGVVWGPIRDMVHVSHGPVGCGWYSWGTRRNVMRLRRAIVSVSATAVSSRERDAPTSGVTTVVAAVTPHLGWSRPARGDRRGGR